MSLDANELDLDPSVEKIATDEATNSCSTDTHKVNAHNEESRNGIEDLYLKFQMLIGNKRCLPDQSQKTTHISDIPPEILLHILKLMTHTSNEYKMLDVCACVCRSWYLYARSPLMYRQACSALWTEDEEYLEEYGGNWRQMFLKRSYVYTHGCYVATLDEFNCLPNYRWLTGYRYFALKFFPDGRVIRLATNTEPSDMSRKINELEDKVNMIPCGRYEFKKNKLILAFNGEISWWHLNNSCLSYSFELDEFNPDWHHTDFLVFKVAKNNSKRFCKLLNVRLKSVRQYGISIDFTGTSLPPFIHSI